MISRRQFPPPPQIAAVVVWPAEIAPRPMPEMGQEFIARDRECYRIKT